MKRKFQEKVTNSLNTNSRCRKMGKKIVVGGFRIAPSLRAVNISELAGTETAGVHMP